MVQPLGKASVLECGGLTPLLKALSSQRTPNYLHALQRFLDRLHPRNATIIQGVERSAPRDDERFGYAV